MLPTRIVRASLTQKRIHEKIEISFNVAIVECCCFANFQFKWANVRSWDVKVKKLPNIRLPTDCASDRCTDCKLDLTVIRPSVRSVPKALGA